MAGMDTPAQAPTPPANDLDVPLTAAGYQQWLATHCYHCGRTNEAIILDGATPGCLCESQGDTDDNGQPRTISTLEAEALR